MRNIFLVLVFFAMQEFVFAKCNEWHISYFPNGKTISQNSLIMVEGRLRAKEIVSGIGEKFPVFLVSGEEEIPLKVKEILVGEIFTAQAILYPAEVLTYGKMYTLRIDNLPMEAKDYILRRFNPEKGIFEPVTWTVIKFPDISAPQWKSEPIFLRETTQKFGCGPEFYEYFSLDAQDSSELLIHVTLKDLKRGVEKKFYFVPEKGKYGSVVQCAAAGLGLSMATTK